MSSLFRANCQAEVQIIMVMILLEDKIDGHDEADKGGEVVPVEALSLEQEADDDGEDGQRDYFLYHFQLHKRKGTAIADETNAVCGYGKAVFNEGNAPRESDDADEGPVAADTGFL